MLEEKKVGVGAYIALAIAIVFFSGIVDMIDGPKFLGLFDFSTLNGSFGSIATPTGSTNFRGAGGTAARDGFMFSLTLLPTVIFALGMVEVFQHYGALEAARKLLTPLLKPLLGLPGVAGLSMIASFQSTDAGAGMTKALYDNGEIDNKQRSIFCAFQFSAGGTITNVIASGAILYALTNTDGSTVMLVPMLIPLTLIFIFKFIGGNIMRLFLNRKKEKVVTDKN